MSTGEIINWLCAIPPVGCLIVGFYLMAKGRFDPDFDSSEEQRRKQRGHKW